MNGSRRQGTWRLVALVVLVWTIAAASAFAEGVRVKIGPASVYERPRTTSDVVLTVQEGTVLDVLKREGDWYWVVLPPDTNGTRRAGYIPVYVCERVGDKRVPEPGIPGPNSRGLPPGMRAGTEAQPNQPRLFIGVGGGGQFGSANFSDHVAFIKSRETGQFDAAYQTKNATAIDATLGVRLGPQFVLGFAFWRSTPLTVAEGVAKVPHPLQSNRPRTATFSGYGASRVETDGHVQITYLVPVTRRIDLAVFAGPSVFYLQQDLLSDFPTDNDRYPYDTFEIMRFVTARKSKLVVGAHVGADLTVMLWRFVGVGLGGRYARGTMNLPSAGTGSIPVEVGGTQLSGGVRLRF